jgi:predicted TIM-barrel fold metal-dependent hydrolase
VVGGGARDAYPDRFGVFASLPLPDVDASLAEIEYAFDALRVDGVVLLTNIAGTYLGDPSFDPVFAELNRRQAIVFLHPTSPPCWEAFSLGLSRPLMEFPFDTTRAVTNLFRSGTFDRCPDLRVIVASGYLYPEVKTALFKQGVKALVEKPYNPEALLEAVAAALRRPGGQEGGNHHFLT